MRSLGLRAVMIVALLAGPGLAAVTLAQPPPQQSEFVPISELPPGDQLPAAPLLIAAYAFVWVVLLAYLWSIGNRIRGVRAEIDRLEQRLGEDHPQRQ